MCICTDEDFCVDRTARCQRTVDVEGGSCGDNTENSTVVACDTSRGRRTSVRHTMGSAKERATHNGVDAEKRAVGNNGRA